MSSVVRRILFASAVLLPLMVVVAALLRGPGERAAAPATPARVVPETGRLNLGQLATYEFFRQGRGEPVAAGRGLFETDYFKPPPTPPAKPKPKPPETREVALFYRGLATFPGEAGVAYLAVDGKVATYGIGTAILGGWTLTGFDADRAVLARGEERLELLFNRRTTVSVPLATKP